jgi:hypothetical protein
MYSQGYDTIQWFSFMSSCLVWLRNLRYFIFICICEGKESIWRSGDIAGDSLNFCTRRKWGVHWRHQLFIAGKIPEDLLNGRIGGIHGPSSYLGGKLSLIYWESKEICGLFSQWPSHYTDRALPASLFSCRNDVEMRWVPNSQVATTSFSRNPPDLNLLVSNFVFCLHVK